MGWQRPVGRVGSRGSNDPHPIVWVPTLNEFHTRIFEFASPWRVRGHRPGTTSACRQGGKRETLEKRRNQDDCRLAIKISKIAISDSSRKIDQLLKGWRTCPSCHV